ncbi:general transcription factor IIE subunit 1-like isoform X1 [Senna tora]|uniref:General transcription factor IIE subunit 1-like isoform X1 n=1 Tax=Senna tora TaxID=362788 RepID=A0A834X655_9FABA|nr:general transcription factor IIE subunit 1-like isoform X1 [Senna tora]
MIDRLKPHSSALYLGRRRSVLAVVREFRRRCSSSLHSPSVVVAPVRLLDTCEIVEKDFLKHGLSISLTSYVLRNNLLRTKFPVASFPGSPFLSELGFDLLSKLRTYNPEKDEYIKTYYAALLKKQQELEEAAKAQEELSNKPIFEDSFSSTSHRQVGMKSNREEDDKTEWEKAPIAVDQMVGRGCIEFPDGGTSKE